MAFGHHWEWRGFGSLPGHLGLRLGDLPLVFPRPQELVDRYLWLPGCELNLKLREGNFKIKRCLRRSTDGVEEWLEDEAEDYEFPLPRNVVAEIAQALHIELEGDEVEDVRTGADLVRTLQVASPELRVIEVAKQRWQHILESTLVEVARIRAPERITTVGLEHPDPERVRSALEELGLRTCLKTSSYLSALQVWARGGSMLQA